MDLKQDAIARWTDYANAAESARAIGNEFLARENYAQLRGAVAAYADVDARICGAALAEFEAARRNHKGADPREIALIHQGAPLLDQAREILINLAGLYDALNDAAQAVRDIYLYVDDKERDEAARKALKLCCGIPKAMKTGFSADQIRDWIRMEKKAAEAAVIRDGASVPEDEPTRIGRSESNDA